MDHAKVLYRCVPSILGTCANHCSCIRGSREGCVCRILRMQATVKDDPMAQEEERMTVVCIRDLSHPHMFI